METISVYATPSGNEKIWSLLSHLSRLISVPFSLLLVVYLSMRGESRYVTDNAREALNFHLSILLYCVCCLPLTAILIGLPLIILIGLAYLVFSIVAAVKAADGGCYSYPLTLRLVK